MTDQAYTDDGYLFSQALSALRVAGSSKSDGWADIRKYWEALANGGADPVDAAHWAQVIASRVVWDVLKAEPHERRNAALKALGLVGVEGDYRRERDYLLLYWEFCALAEEAGRSFAPTTRRQFAQRMLDGGYFEGLSVKQVMKAIDHIKKRALSKKVITT